MSDFVHLHTHSEYSMLDGLGRVKDLVAEARRLGHGALALTDHGVMHGAVEFSRACRAQEIKPIIGVEAYQTVWGRPMNGRDSQFDRENYHLLLLAKSMAGYRNLLKIASHAQTGGYYYKPRVDHDFLAAHAEGLVCTTGCLGAEVPQLLSQGKEKEAYERLGWYVETFGKESFFIELQEHSIPELIPVNKSLVPWAKKFGIGLLATNDVHYVREEDADPHEMLLCVQTGESIKSEKRMKLSDGSYFLKSRAQMEATFAPLIDLPSSAYDNSVLIAEMCDVDVEDKEYHLPDIEIPEGYNYETYLRHLTEKGLAELYGERANDPEVQARKEHELKIIHQMGFDVYFLIVADLCDFARSRNIWWNVRGSGAGSVVAYTIGITGLDPLKNNLIFERFLNPDRVSMPDFDLDYPDDQREELIRYTIEKYGGDQVAQIVTFGRMKARAAIRDVGRAQEVNLDDVDRIAKLIPAIPGKPVTIQEVMTEGHEFYSQELVDLYKKQPWVSNLLDYSMKLEGVARHSGIHAAAVIVADRELTHYTPLMRASKGSITGAITQYEFPVLESIGLLKVDFLGLSTLSVMREAARLIRERHGVEYTLRNIPFEGDETENAFKLLSAGEVSGVFQVDGAGMRRVLTEMQPNIFEHIIATISLYRPGPIEYIPNYIRRLHSEEEIEFKHEKLEPILGETYGICVSGDALVTDARTGRRYRLDEVEKVDDFVIQGVDEQWQPAAGRVTHWIDSGTKPVFELTLRNGARVKVTGDHRLLTERGWRPLNEINVGEYVATPQHLFGPDDGDGLAIDRRQLRVLAYLIGDGSLASMASVDFVSKDSSMLAEYERCLSAFEDVRPVYTEQVRGVMRIGAAKKKELDAHYHTPTSLLGWMRELGFKHAAGSRPGGLRSHEKFVPSFVFELGPSDIAFFLASLWDCDGYVGNELCHYKTISQQLADDVQTLLLRLGIRSTIYAADYKNIDAGTERTGYQVTTYETGRLTELLQPHMVSPKREIVCTRQSHSTIERDSFIQEVDSVIDLPYRTLMREYGIDRQHFYPKGRQRSRISSAVVASLTQQVALPQTERRLNTDWQEVASIEPVGEERVFDLTVEGLHSFVANNIVVHNCIYQEQIIQILTNLAGYSPGQADIVRRAISKKKASEIEKHKKIFIDGCSKNGVPKKAAAAIYADIEFFARYGFNKCLPGDVEVVDAATGRLVRVEDLYTGEAQLEQTLTCDTDALKLQAGAVSAVMDNGVKSVYRLTTALGRTIEATANHPFYTFNGWRLLEELQVGGQIAVPRRLPVEGQQRWPDHEVITLGHLLAEGNLCHPHSVYFYSQDADQVQDYVDAAESFENVECSLAIHKETYSVYAKRVARAVEPGIVTWAKSLGIWGKNALQKTIPDAAFELNNEQIGLLISRMWEGDGHINTTDRSLYYATSSERMARQLQHLLLRLGIVSRLRTVNFPYKEGRIGYQLFVTGNDNLSAFRRWIGTHFISEKRREQMAELVLNGIVVSGTKDVIPIGVKELVRSAKEQAGITWPDMNRACGVAQREFYPVGASTKSGFTRSTIARLADYFAHDGLHRYAHSDIYWDKIIGIEYVGEKRTYDLEVPGTHNFVANDILVHNSHAADYAVITVQTAYLKAKYPVEYMAALLLIERDKTEKVTNFIGECRRMGIDVLAPDINYSGLDFEIQTLPTETQSQARRDPNIGFDFPIPEGSAIRFGMAAIKNVGENPVRAILEGRAEGGGFTSLEDLCDRVDLRKVGKRPLECLIKAGALDRFGQRSQLLDVIEQLVAQSAGIHSARASGQISMFDMLGGAAAVKASPIRLPNIDEAPGREKLQWEKELLGIYVASHPLQQLNIDLTGKVTCQCAELNESHDGSSAVLVGMISDVRQINTKKGDRMAFVQLEDLSGTCDVVIFPRTFEEYGARLEIDSLVLVKGTAQTRQGKTSLLADSIQTHIESAVQKLAVSDEYLQYQEPLAGGSWADSPAAKEASVGFVSPSGQTFVAGEDDEDDDIDSSADDAENEFGEQSPFRNDMPAWMVEKEMERADVTVKDRVVKETAASFIADEERAVDKVAEVEAAGKVELETEIAPVSDEPQAPAVEEPAVEEPVDESADNKLVVESEVQAAKEPPAKEASVEAEHRAPPALANGHAPSNGYRNGQHQHGHHRNGYSNGSGHVNGQATGPTTRALQITFRRSGNLERDKYRLKQIYDCVCDPKGRDRFVIIIESGSQRTQLAFPNDGCTISERLVGELTGAFKLEVEVEGEDG